MNDEKFWSFKFLILKYGREDQMIYLFCKIGSLQEIRFLLFDYRKLKKTEKITTERGRID